MSIRVSCTCGKIYQVADDNAGKRIRCKKCFAELPVPSSPVHAGIMPPPMVVPPPLTGSTPVSRRKNKALLIVAAVTVGIVLAGVILYRLSVDTPLMKSVNVVSFASVEEVEHILRRDRNINAQPLFGTGNSALHELAGNLFMDIYKKERLIALFLSEGADVHSLNNGGWTPLHSLAFSQNYTDKMVYMMVARGANPNARDKDGKTPLDYFNGTY